MNPTKNRGWTQVPRKDLFVCLMVLNATFNNISVILWRSVLLAVKTTDLLQVTDKLYHIMSYTSPYSNSQHQVMRFQKRRFEKRISCGGHVWKRIGTKWAIIIEDLHRCFLPSVVSFGHAVSEEKIWNKNCLWPPCLKTDRDEMSNLYREILRTKFRFIWPRGFRGED